jgi:DNA-directed RNA polymerase subunit omega
MSEKLEGIVSPSIDNLMGKVDSKYELVMFAAKRARQINDYYSALHEGSLFNNVGPLVDVTIDEKPLTIALHEIDKGYLDKRNVD